MEVKPFGEAVRKRRKELNLTAEKLAQKVGVDRTYISKIEKHNLLPSIPIVRKLDKHLKSDFREIYHKNQFKKLTESNRRFYYTSAKYLDYVGEETLSDRDRLFMDLKTTALNSTLWGKDDFLKFLTKKFKVTKANNKKIQKEIKTIFKKIHEEDIAYWNKFHKHIEKIVKLLES